MRGMRRCGTAAAAAVLLFAGGMATTSAQPPPPGPTQGPGAVEASREAATQDYALLLRDAEARLRAAHERMAAGGAEAAPRPGTPPARQELVDAAQAARETIRNAPPHFAGTEAHATADRRFEEGIERLQRDSEPPAADADVAREMLQALGALREAAGAPPATGAPGDGAPTEPAAQGGGRI